MDRSLVTKYFNENSEAWLQSSYEADGYDFPTALSRQHRLMAIIQDKYPGGGSAVADLGCGSGRLCVELARLGHTATGVDESGPMLDQAASALADLPTTVQSRVSFSQGDILTNGLLPESYDVVTAMGVIGYLSDDLSLFREAYRLLKPGGRFLVSCRNRLLNMVSISGNTLREIDNGAASELVDEIRGLLQPVGDQDAKSFVSALTAAAAALDSEPLGLGVRPAPENHPGFTTSIEARQHTPKGLLAAASAEGFQHEGFYGVHPHLLMAGLNRSLPPTVFNVLSSSLETLSHLPVSLIWSSVFIGVFRKAD